MQENEEYTGHEELDELNEIEDSAEEYKRRREVRMLMEQRFEQRIQGVRNIAQKGKLQEDMFSRMAYICCARFGARQADLAELFGVNKNTIVAWQDKSRKFKEAVQKGRDHFDSQVVERVYLKRALGYDFDEKYFKRKINPETNEEELILERVVRKSIAPDIKAIEGWLALRSKKRWGALRDRTFVPEEAAAFQEEVVPKEVVVKDGDAATKEQKQKERESIMHILKESGALDVLSKSVEASDNEQRKLPAN